MNLKQTLQTLVEKMALYLFHVHPPGKRYAPDYTSCVRSLSGSTDLVNGIDV